MADGLSTEPAYVSVNAKDVEQPKNEKENETGRNIGALMFE